ncbi:lanthionine synthetase LanC family protein [Actinomadura rayongensis]|uniref:Lanthionine synthetase n=1 Tax=Actinomadura rayongensis TaxID=1429076 RepID=A0A6I4W9Y6_9ACTN|nr:lanthionine synthetase [Actinomadura rayongensis]
MTAGQSLAEGAAGIALWHLESGQRAQARAALEHAVADGVSVAGGASLYYGAPALAYVLTTATAASGLPGLTQATAVAVDGTRRVVHDRLEAAHRRIDRRERPEYAEYDLIRGLTGLGVVLRRIGEPDLLRKVLDYLVRLTEPLDGLPGWWNRTGPHRDRTDWAGGHSNHGIAHGIPGPLALLSLTHLDGTHVPGHLDAIARITAWLDAWEQHTDNGSAWWPQWLSRDEMQRGQPNQPGPLRPSWCYGTPGIARAQQLAGRAVSDAHRQRHAEAAFTACAQDPTQTRRLTDRSLCHGTAGLLATGRRIAADASTPIPQSPLVRLHANSGPDDEPAGFLDGAAGAVLATATTTTSWDACLLLY